MQKSSIINSNKKDSHLESRRFKNRKAAEKCRLSKNIRLANEIQKLELLMKENENLNHTVKVLEECLKAMHQLLKSIHTGNSLNSPCSESVENFEMLNIGISEETNKSFSFSNDCERKHFDDMQRLSLIELNDKEQSLLLSLPDEFYDSLMEFL